MYVTVIRYHRVSTEVQNLERQTQATEGYVAETFPDHAEVRTLADADTGTDTDLQGYTELIAAAETVSAD